MGGQVHGGRRKEADMRHAVVVRVKLDPDAEIELRGAILTDSVIPAVKKLPGFQKAKWMSNGSGIGLWIVLFDTDEHAEAAVSGMTPPDGPEVISCEVYEVEIEIEGDARAISGTRA